MRVEKPPDYIFDKVELERPWQILTLIPDYPWLKKHGVGLIEFVWGCDIFIGRVPFMKSIVLANILVWLVLFQ